MDNENIDRFKQETEQIKNKINKFSDGYVFTEADFSDLKLSIESIHRGIKTAMTHETDLREIEEGIYYKVEYSTLLKERELPPCVNRVIHALIAQTQEKIQLHGAIAANQLGFSTQMPLFQLFYTNGQTRELKISGQKIQFRHIDDHYVFQHQQTKIGYILSALYYLDQALVTAEYVQKIKKILNAEEFEILKKSELPMWLHNLLNAKGDRDA